MVLLGLSELLLEDILVRLGRASGGGFLSRSSGGSGRLGHCDENPGRSRGRRREQFLETGAGLDQTGGPNGAVSFSRKPVEIEDGRMKTRVYVACYRQARQS